MVFKTCIRAPGMHRGMNGNGHAFLIEKEFQMKKFNLRAWLFMALCCDFGLFSKKLVSPAANLITDFLHIPGGIATSFSLMFLVIAASVIPVFGCASIMGAVQSMLALFFGMTGSMGFLAPIGYILPGIVIDLILCLSRKIAKDPGPGIMPAMILSSVTACLTATVLVFRLRGLVLLLYVCVSAASGSLCGLLTVSMVCRLKPIIFSYREVI